MSAFRRFKVVFNGHRFHCDAVDESGAVEWALGRMRKVFREAGVEPPIQLGSAEMFRAVCQVIELPVLGII